MHRVAPRGGSLIIAQGGCSSTGTLIIAQERFSTGMFSSREENPQIEHLVAHSLGGALTAEAIKDNPNVGMVGVDAARVLNKGDLKHVRNINTDSFFDMKVLYYYLFFFFLDHLFIFFISFRESFLRYFVSCYSMLSFSNFFL